MPKYILNYYLADIIKFLCIALNLFYDFSTVCKKIVFIEFLIRSWKYQLLGIFCFVAGGPIVQIDSAHHVILCSQNKIWF